MATVKTAISLENTLFEQIDVFANVRWWINGRS